MSLHQSAYQSIPSIEELLHHRRLAGVSDAGHERIANALRDATRTLRAAIADNQLPAAPEEFSQWLIDRALESLVNRQEPTLVRVYNLSGTVLHTNLGRATMPTRAIQAMQQAAAEPVNIEFDLQSGQRGHRDDHVQQLLCELTGAEAVCVVNNNAAAVMLVLNSLARDREVPVSRGELIEIGGAFRMPDIMAQSGCHLVEVGTTNRTHLADYERAISERTAALMIVHPSNYAVTGFTSKPARGDIARLAHANGLPLIDDMGSGTLINLEDYGLPHEATVAESIRSGADIVTFSGDKLLGGPQAGLIVGRQAIIDRINRNPMKRAMRVDKVTMAALQAVLQLYLQPGALVRELPVLRLLVRPLAEIDACAQRVLPTMQQYLQQHATLDVVDCMSQIGSGALPSDTLHSRAVRLRPTTGSAVSAEQWRRRLRLLPTPVIGRVQDNAVLLDMRTLEHETGFLAQLQHLREMAE